VIYAEHRVRKGERLASISKRYGVKASVIARANRIKPHSRLDAGLVLLIPKKTGTQGISSDLEPTDQENPDEKMISKRASRKSRGGRSTVAANKGNEKNASPLRLRYQIRKGDSLASIAEKFDVEVSMIKKWNNVKGDRKIQQGKTLTLFISKGNPDRDEPKKNGKSGKPNFKKTKVETAGRIKLVNYTVKKGDSLSEIAQKFNTTPHHIRTWNHLSAKETIKPGDKLSLKLKRPTVENI
jgi:membrane-bound lytic murein transglycosylase D